MIKQLLWLILALVVIGVIGAHVILIAAFALGCTLAGIKAYRRLPDWRKQE